MQCILFSFRLHRFTTVARKLQTPPFLPGQKGAQESEDLAKEKPVHEPPTNNKTKC